MQPHRETLLCRYHYDPLDRLADCTPTAQANTQRFYLKDRLATEVQGARQRSIMQHEDQLLAQQQRQNGRLDNRLLATDRQRSVLAILDATPLQHLAYTPYGHRVPESGLLSLLGFNGERPDPVTGHYLLGNGYRAFNPVLMRFNSPDSWSPFGRGGLNAYGYCGGDPVNGSDPTGHSNFFTSAIKGIMNMFGRIPSHARNTANQPMNQPAYQSVNQDMNQSSNMKPQTSKSFTIATDQRQTSGPEPIHSELSSSTSRSPGLFSNTPQNSIAANNSMQHSGQPSHIRVQNIHSGDMRVVNVSTQDLANIRLVARANPFILPGKASSIVRSLANLPNLGPDEVYMFPNVRHS